MREKRETFGFGFPRNLFIQDLGSRAGAWGSGPDCHQSTTPYPRQRREKRERKRRERARCFAASNAPGCFVEEGCEKHRGGGKKHRFFVRFLGRSTTADTLLLVGEKPERRKHLSATPLDAVASWRDKKRERKRERLTLLFRLYISSVQLQTVASCSSCTCLGVRPRTRPTFSSNLMLLY